MWKLNIVAVLKHGPQIFLPFLASTSEAYFSCPWVGFWLLRSVKDGRSEAMSERPCGFQLPLFGPSLWGKSALIAGLWPPWRVTFGALTSGPRGVPKRWPTLWASQRGHLGTVLPLDDYSPSQHLTVTAGGIPSENRPPHPSHIPNPQNSDLNKTVDLLPPLSFEVIYFVAVVTRTWLKALL